jgi:hypothetical protein
MLRLYEKITTLAGIFSEWIIVEFVFGIWLGGTSLSAVIY